jgi:hypothetical protein
MLCIMIFMKFMRRVYELNDVMFMKDACAVVRFPWHHYDDAMTGVGHIMSSL